jgi:hypothetical protein
MLSFDFAARSVLRTMDRETDSIIKIKYLAGLVYSHSCPKTYALQIQIDTPRSKTSTAFNHHGPTIFRPSPQPRWNGKDIDQCALWPRHDLTANFALLQAANTGALLLSIFYCYLHCTVMLCYDRRSSVRLWLVSIIILAKSA